MMYDLFVENVMDAWKSYTRDRTLKTARFYGRICALDLKAVKTIVRKDENLRRILKHALHILFDFKIGTRRLLIWKNHVVQYVPYMPDIKRNELNVDYDTYGGLHPSNQPDYISRVSRGSHSENLKSRIEHKEQVTLKILRFLLRKGCNPNDKYFLANMIFKHKYHSRTFLLKIIGMCSHYGLEPSTMFEALKMPWLREYEMSYYVSPLLAIHKEKLNIKDNISLCCSWASKKNLLKATSSSLGNLSKLNDDVIGIISSFVYPYVY